MITLIERKGFIFRNFNNVIAKPSREYNNEITLDKNHIREINREGWTKIILRLIREITINKLID